MITILSLFDKRGKRIIPQSFGFSQTFTHTHTHICVVSNNKSSREDCMQTNCCLNIAHSMMLLWGAEEKLDKFIYMCTRWGSLDAFHTNHGKLICSNTSWCGGMIAENNLAKLFYFIITCTWESLTRKYGNDAWFYVYSWFFKKTKCTRWEGVGECYKVLRELSSAIFILLIFDYSSQTTRFLQN